MVDINEQNTYNLDKICAGLRFKKMNLLQCCT